MLIFSTVSFWCNAFYFAQFVLFFGDTSLMLWLPVVSFHSCIRFPFGNHTCMISFKMYWPYTMDIISPRSWSYIVLRQVIRFCVWFCVLKFFLPFDYIWIYVMLWLCSFLCRDREWLDRGHMCFFFIFLLLFVRFLLQRLKGDQSPNNIKKVLCHRKRKMYTRPTQNLALC